MRILFKQPTDDALQKSSVLRRFGISAFHLKLVEPAKDRGNITPRPHHHTSCELHVILQGGQRYAAEGNRYALEQKHVIIFPPNVPHQHLYSAPDTRKFSMSFSVSAPTALALHLTRCVRCIPVPPAAQDALHLLESEANRRTEYADALTECTLFTFLLALGRATGLEEKPLPPLAEEDPRVAMAKQYVADNIDRPITCPELAAYCHISPKQLTRLFLENTGLAPAAYIRSRRVVRMEQLLTETDLPLKQVSELLRFTSEYHFNSFFTKYAGMTPGAFRKMMNRGN